MIQFFNEKTSYRRFLIGFSGGLDSTVLLHRFKLWRDKQHNIKLRAVHINYNLSINSNKWVNHCISICKDWKISLLVFNVILGNKGIGIEAEARKARYEIFKNILTNDEILITAHHLDDQCETFLLALKRGSGPTGLSGIKKCIKFSSTYLIRPLINETRASLKHWAKINSLNWIEDESNQNNSYDRNFLRNNIIPLLIKRWPNISYAIARSAILCAEQENLIDELLNKELLKLTSVKGTIEINKLTNMSQQKRSALLRRWFANNNVLMPSKYMLNKIWKEIAQAHPSKSPFMHFKEGYNIYRFKGLLWIIKSISSCKDLIITWHNIHQPLILPEGIGLIFLNDKNQEKEKSVGNIRLPLPNETVSVRFKASGMLHIFGYHHNNNGRKLKKIWQDMNVPPWERNTTPLIFYNEQLITAVNKFITLEGWKEEGISFIYKRPYLFI